MLWICALITMLALLAGAYALATGTLPGHRLTESEAEDLRSMAAFGAIAPLFYFVMRFYQAARAAANAIQVGPDQFADLHARCLQLAQRMGLQSVPQLYVINGNGVVNAYALSCNRRRKYIVVHAEIAHLLDSDPATVDFVLAHELAHHRMGHVTLWRILVNIIPSVPLLPGKSLIRAQEYSADRLALHTCAGCVDGITLLAAGGSMYRKVNLQSYREQCERQDRDFWVRVVNWFSDHAVMSKRYRALKRIEERGFCEHGQMF